MSWRFPFIVIDQNQMRDANVVASLLDRCCRDNFHILIPDIAGFEFPKGLCPQKTWTASLCELAPYRELVCVSRKLTNMMAEESQRGEPCRKLIDDNLTSCLRSILRNLEVGDDSAVREITEKQLPKFLPSSREVWENHEAHKAWITTLQGLREFTDPTQLKRMRTAPLEGLVEWLSSDVITSFVFQGLKKGGLDKSIALRLTLEPSVRAGFVSALAALAGYWLASGGLESAPAAKLTNDLLDTEYVILGALSEGLCTQDKRARIIYESVSAAFDTRLKLASSARHLGPHWPHRVVDLATEKRQVNAGA